MSKSLIKILRVVTVPDMGQNKKPHASMDKSIGFRPPDQKFCDGFNAALEATGVTANDLCIAAIRHGLIPAASELLTARREKETVFLEQHLPKRPNSSGKK